MGIDYSDVDRPRRKRGAPIAIIVLGGVGCLFLGGVLVVLVATGKVKSPVAVLAQHQSSDWTYKELLEHLRSKGMKVKMRNYSSDTYFYDPKDEDGMDAIAQPNGFSLLGGDDVIRVNRHASKESARQFAGTAESGVFAWGIWTFEGTEKALKPYRKALQ